jgi:DNA-binding response OmpR family regulator
MPRRLFLFEWDKTSANARVKVLRAAGWTVSVETEDGARGGSKVLKQPPDVIVFDLAKRPSHSRETASGIRGYKAGRSLPMVFVDGTGDDVAKTEARVSAALFTTSTKLLSVLNRFPDSEPTQKRDSAINATTLTHR